VIGTGIYFDYYYGNRNNLAVPSSLLDPMTDSAYQWSNQRKALRSVQDGLGPAPVDDDDGDNVKNEGNSDDLASQSYNASDYYPYTDPNRIRELTAAYYGLVEELDDWVGHLLERLETTGMVSNTYIVFTSDHGDMLGAHGMTGKNVLMEEAVRVPLILSAPNVWEGGRVLKRPVSHLSMFATLLDYAGASEYDTSDGSSLRSFIERRSYNQNVDDDVIVVETNGRRPLTPGNFTRLSGVLGGQPSFMVRKREVKLIVPRTQRSSVLDMMYNLTMDPLEMTNLLSDCGSDSTTDQGPSDAVIGKAEHLKILLVEWLMRRDGGEYQYYSSPAYHMDEGLGDVEEITRRRTWRALPLWISDTTLSFGKPVEVSISSRSSSSHSSSAPPWIMAKYVRNEYLYLGRTSDGSALLWFDVQGPDAAHFTLDQYRAMVSQGEYVRIRVTFTYYASINASDSAATTRMTSTPLSAYIRVKTSINGALSYHNIVLRMVQDEDEEEVLIL
jgi:hypothetical protein